MIKMSAILCLILNKVYLNVTNKGHKREILNLKGSEDYEKMKYFIITALIYC